MRRAARGFTLVELMVGLAILAVLLATAAPFMGDLVSNGRLREAGNLVFSELLMAQSEAVKRNTTVRVSLSGSSVETRDMSNPGTPVVLRTRTLPVSATLTATTVDFGPEGRPAPFGTSIAINVGSSSGTCSDDLRCPGVRVDAGGATRFCSNHQVNCP